MDETSELFDEFGHRDPNPNGVRRSFLVTGLVASLRGLSFLGRWVAILTVAYLIGRHAVPVFASAPLAMPLKSAIPLIAVGASYFFLILTLRRTVGQRLVGFSVSAAFILWGVEQYVDDHDLAALIDEVVVFSFVVDLAIVIRHNLASCAGEGRVRKAGFPTIKTMETFRFGAQPSIDEIAVRGLLKGDYLDRGENIVIVGKPGTGKTHLALSLGYAACLENRKVLFMGAASLVDRLRQRHVQGRLPGYLRKLRRSDLLVVDDLGAARLTALEAELLVELLNGGERRMSFVVTTPLPLVEWDEFFGNDRLAIAIAGRQLSGAHVIESMGEPYRGFPVRAGALKTDRSGGTAEEPAKPVE